MKRKIVLGVGGSSGSIFAKLLMDKLNAMKHIQTGVVMSDNAVLNWEIEIGPFDRTVYSFDFYEKNDFMAPFASGSARYDTMIVCPASMGVLARIAAGLSSDLMTRAADVMLKERRRLILMPREAPYGLIHLQNMTRLTEAGAIICPASPSFYSQPKTIEEACNTVVDRILDLADLPVDTYRWNED